MAWIDRVAPWWARTRAEKELPAAATKLGLTFNEGEYKSEIGTLSGIIGGHEVLVRPDKPAIIVEHRKRTDGIDFSTWSPSGLRRPKVNFDSGNRDFDRRFKKRLLAKQWQQKLSGLQLFFDAMVAFHRKWHRVMTQLDVDTVRFSAWMKERWLAICYISAADLEGMLPEMIRIVDTLEEALR